MEVEYNDNLNGIPIFRTQINFNITPLKRSYLDKWYLVIHDTANTAHDATDYMHYKYFRSGNKDSSADFFVDHDSITKLNDYFKNYSWHCGDNDNGYRHPECTNRNSIGIEICVNWKDDSEKMKATISNAVILVRQLMSDLNIPIERVLRHFDVSHKFCPGTIPFVDNSPGVCKNWLDFKTRLTQTISNPNHDLVDEMFKDGLILDKQIWYDVMDGKKTPELNWIKLICQRAVSKI